MFGEVKWGDGMIVGFWDEGVLEGRDGELNKGIWVEFGGICKILEMDKEVKGIL